VIQQAGFVVALAYMAVLHATNIHRIALTSQQAARQSVLVYRIWSLSPRYTNSVRNLDNALYYEGTRKTS
jgi:hypothetical protein